MAKKKKNIKENEEMIKIQGEDEVKTTEEAVESEPVTEEKEECAAKDGQEPEEETAGETEAQDTGDDAEAEAEDAAEDEEDKEDDSSDDDADDEDDEKKPSRRKDKKDELIADLQDKLTRRMAEFDNFRKRTEKEKAQMYSMGARDVLEKMLDVLDNFERGFDAVEKDDQDDAFVQGMQMVYKQMLDVLDKLGVKPIEAVGQPFDPNFHNAVMHEDSEEAGENEVTAEFQKGYMYHDDVIRHSMVKVAN